MSQFEDFRLPLHFAVHMNRPEMVGLLIALGAQSVRDRCAPDSCRPRTRWTSTPTGSCTKLLRRAGYLDLFTALAVDDIWWPRRSCAAYPTPISRGGILHLMAKRGHVVAVKWLVANGADPNAMWTHWDADVTPLHLAVLGNHPDSARALLDAGANPRLKDSKHDSDAIGWAEFFGRRDLAEMLSAGKGIESGSHRVVGCARSHRNPGV